MSHPVKPPGKPASTTSPPAKPLAAGGKLVGIGVQFAPEAQSLRVITIHAGGGAEAVGMVVRDHVIAVDGMAVAKLGREGTVGKILGAANVQVAITLWRNNAAVTFLVNRIPPKKKLSLEFSDVSEVLERKISP